MDSTNQPLLDVRNLQIEFATDEGWVQVVTGVDFTIERGETLGLVGESGSGKTVTALALMGLIPNPPGRVVGGEAWFGDIDLLALSDKELRDLRGNEIGMIFQEPMTSLNPAFTVGKQISEVIIRHTGCSRQEARKRTIELLDRVGIPHPEERLKEFPHAFSGGMRQRVMIAMAISCNPMFLIADEPTTALDVTIQAQILRLLKELQSEYGMSILLVTHDLGVVAAMSDKVAVMYAGQIVEFGDADPGVFDQPAHPYTEGLLAAMPQVHERRESLQDIPGSVPQAGKFPPGCRFHPRCGYAREGTCTEGEMPILAENGHSTRCIRKPGLTLKGAE